MASRTGAKLPAAPARSVPAPPRPGRPAAPPMASGRRGQVDLPRVPRGAKR